MTKVNEGVDMLRKMKVEAEKYENCLSEWAQACGVKYPTFNSYFKRRSLTPKILKVIEVGIPVILKYQNMEQEVIKKAQVVFNR